jgi:hypothetical protein
MQKSVPLARAPWHVSSLAIQRVCPRYGMPPAGAGDASAVAKGRESRVAETP